MISKSAFVDLLFRALQACKTINENATQQKTAGRTSISWLEAMTSVDLYAFRLDPDYLNQGDMVMELKFAAAAKPTKLCPEISRRQKLVSRIDEQIGLVRKASEGQLSRAAWFWMDQKGSLFLAIKYGRLQLELKKGMFSIQCSNLEEVEHSLCTIRTMTLKGDLDHQLASAAKQIREKFKSK